MKKKLLNVFSILGLLSGASFAGQVSVGSTLTILKDLIIDPGTTETLLASHEAKISAGHRSCEYTLKHSSVNFKRVLLSGAKLTVSKAPPGYWQSNFQEVCGKRYAEIRARDPRALLPDCYFEDKWGASLKLSTPQGYVLSLDLDCSAGLLAGILYNTRKIQEEAIATSPSLVDTLGHLLELHESEPTPIP